CCQQGVFCYAGCRIYPHRHIANQLQSQLYEHNRALEYTSAFYLYPATVPGNSNTDYQHSRKPWTLDKEKGHAYNKGFSAMLASEYILIDISLISYSPSFTNITELWNIPSAFYLYPATVPG